MISFYESSARERINHLVDPNTFVEILPPSSKEQSPHLKLLNIVSSFDDGIIIGKAKLNNHSILIASQEGKFMGGTVGEVHGAKLVGLLQSAIACEVKAVYLLIDSGGVRLHEANAGLIAISEIMRAIFILRNHNIPVYAIIGSQNGCFGGMGIVAACCNAVCMNEEGRWGVSGPEVIETVCGVEEFDSQDKPLVWRTLGGKHRYIMKAIDIIVPDDVNEFKKATYTLLNKKEEVEISLESIKKAQNKFKEDLKEYKGVKDALDIWRLKNINKLESISLLNNSDFLNVVKGESSGN